MDAVLEFLPRLGAILTLIIGFIGFFRPQLFTEKMGIQLNGPEAFSEIRAVMGGMNIGTSAAALLLNSPLVYITLGVAWFFLLLARLYSMAVDGGTLKQSLPGIVVDGVIAALFLSGFWQ